MLTTSNKPNSSAIHAIDYTTLIPSTHQFEEAFKSKSNLHVITFKVLWSYLTQLKKNEIDFKKSTNQNEYQTIGTQLALFLAPKILAVEKLLLTLPTHKHQNEIQDKIIQLFISHLFETFYSDNDLKRLISGSTEQQTTILKEKYYHAIKISIQQYSLSIKSDPSKKDEPLNNGKIGIALSTPSSIGMIFGTYSYTDEESFAKLALVFYTLSRIELINLFFNEKINYFKQQIEILTQNTLTTLLSDPLSQLDKQVSHYKSELNRATEHYESKQLLTTVNNLTKPLEDKAKEFINTYQKQIESLQIRFSDYPKSVEEPIKKALSEAKDIQNEREKIQKDLLTIKHKQFHDYKKIQQQLSHELQGEPHSKKDILLKHIKDFKLTIPLDFFPNSKALNTTLETKSESLEKNFDSTCRIWPLIYKEKIHSLAHEISIFENDYPKKNSGILKQLLLDYKFALNDYFISAKKNIPYDTKIGNSSLNFHDLIKSIIEHSIPDLEKNSSQITLSDTAKQVKILNLSLNTIKKTLDDKIAQIQASINQNNTYKKDRHLDDNLLDHASKALPPLFIAKSQQYKAELEKLHESTKERLTKNGQTHFSKQCISILQNFDIHIEQLMDKLKSIDIHSAKNHNTERAYLDETIKKSQTTIHPPKMSTQTIALGVLAGITSMLFAPIAWLYGVYRLSNLINNKTKSSIYTGLSVVAAFICMPISWIYGGIQLTKSIISKLDNNTPQRQNIIIQQPYTKPIPAIKLPKVDLKDMFKTTCMKKSIPISSNDTQLKILTEPNHFLINEAGALYLIDKDAHIRCGFPATCLLLRIFSVLNHANDLKLQIEKGFICLEINSELANKRFYIVPGNGDDKNLIYVNERQHSRSKTPLNPKQIDTDEALKSILYSSINESYETHSKIQPQITTSIAQSPQLQKHRI